MIIVDSLWKDFLRFFTIIQIVFISSSHIILIFQLFCTFVWTILVIIWVIIAYVLWTFLASTFVIRHNVFLIFLLNRLPRIIELLQSYLQSINIVHVEVNKLRISFFKYLLHLGRSITPSSRKICFSFFPNLLNNSMSKTKICENIRVKGFWI